jgi:hypothetical protein
MAFLIKAALGWGLPSWAAKVVGWLVPALLAVALIGGAIALIYHKGETAGGAKVEVKAEKAHAKTVAEARTDERQAQATVDAIGKRVAIADDKTTTLVRFKISEIHDALDTTPGAAAGNAAAPAAAFDTSGVRASLNALVDGANGAADAADAER